MSDDPRTWISDADRAAGTAAAVDVRTSTNAAPNYTALGLGLRGHTAPLLIPRGRPRLCGRPGVAPADHASTRTERSPDLTMAPHVLQ